MPSTLHEALLLLLRNQLPLAPTLLRDALGVPLPPYAHLHVEHTDLSQLTPTEYRADLVLSLRASSGSEPLAALVIEAQLQRDPKKRRSWPAYVVQLHHCLGCPVHLLVVAPDPKVAVWCAEPIHVSGMVLTPLVLGPDTIPVVTDFEEAAHNPELATLSVLAHGTVGIAVAAALAVHPLDDDRRRLYYDLIRSSLDTRDLPDFETQMTQYHVYQSEFAQKYYHQGIAEGEAKGEAKGKAKGLAEGEAKAVFAVLHARGITVSESSRHRILACVDIDQLDQWLRRAATATSEPEIFD